MSRDTKEMHKADLVAEILQEAQAGATQEAIRVKHHVALKFIQNVLDGTVSDCSCGRSFFAHKDGQRWGSRECFTEAVRGLSKMKE